MGRKQLRSQSLRDLHSDKILQNTFHTLHTQKLDKKLDAKDKGGQRRWKGKSFDVLNKHLKFIVILKKRTHTRAPKHARTHVWLTHLQTFSFKSSYLWLGLAWLGYGDILYQKELQTYFTLAQSLFAGVFLCCCLIQISFCRFVRSFAHARTFRLSIFRSSVFVWHSLLMRLLDDEGVILYSPEINNSLWWLRLAGFQNHMHPHVLLQDVDSTRLDASTWRTADFLFCVLFRLF